MLEPQTRRDFLATILTATGLAPLLGVQGAETLPMQQAPQASLTHVPRTLAEVDALDETQKTLIAAATASGCEAVAYYQRAADGSLELKAHIDLYPTKTTEFPPTASEQVPGDDAIRAGAAFPIALKNGLNETQGLIVLQPPRTGWGRVQSAQEEAGGEDFHEPLATRKAKYEMAAHIAQHGKDTLLAGDQGFSRAAGGKPTSFRDKQEYFKTLREDFINILGAEGKQAKHVTGVSDLMMLATDVINDDKPIIGEAQKAMLRDITVLHDVGKLQMSIPFLNQEWRKGATDPEEEKADRYGMGQNHNHPLFTRLILGAYPDEALVTAAHHHGLLRYTDKELQAGMGV